MSQSDVRNAIGYGKQSVKVVVVTDSCGRCSLRPASRVAKAPNSLFNLVVISRFSEAIATGKPDLVDKEKEYTQLIKHL